MRILEFPVREVLVRDDEGETMRWTQLTRNVYLGVSLLCLGLPEAEALEIFAPPSVAAHMDDGLITQVRVVRGGGGHRGGGAYRGGAHRGGAYRGGAYRGGAYRGGAYRGGAYRGGAYRAGGVYRYGGWTRPAGYGWRPGGAIAAGAAIGFVSAAAAASWAGAAPGPGLCWYYTDPSRRQGFWDACQ